jgi:hypothetical protein
MVIRIVHPLSTSKQALTSDEQQAWNMTSEQPDDIYLNNEYTDFPGGMSTNLDTY